MVGAGRIEALSISFLTGTIIAAALKPSGCVFALLCVLGLLLWGLSAFPERVRGVWPYLLLFALLGFVGYGIRSLQLGDKAISSLPLERLTLAIDRVEFPHPQTSALVKALLSGVRDDISPEIRKSFRDSGASHILALSGLHLGVIYGMIAKSLSLLGGERRIGIFRSLLTLSLCAFYTIVTGAGPSTVRALLFIALREAGNIDVRRRASPARIYCIALLVQLAISPEVILSAGFQLSYLAMCGIVFVFPLLKGWMPDTGVGLLDKYLPSKWIWNCMALTLSCQLFTAPLVWLKFGTFPKYFLLTNLVALPLSEMLIVCAVATVILSLLGIDLSVMNTVTDRLACILTQSLTAIASI